ncbi:MAG: hypothetical protein SFY56_13145 [Bacteroidota bacterium]|nr:hypothetical protein [Bacteroidota bacterium]
MLKLIYKSFFLSAILILSSCGGEKIDETTVTDDDSNKKAVTETKLNAQNVFNSVPDRVQILKLIEENKIEYNGDLLNNPNSVSKYNIEFYKAVNLGIYGSDLSIANSFEETQESLLFLKCVNSLASNIGVSKAFDQKMFDRMEANKNNKDSTLEIVTGAFKKSDEILKDDGRAATSAVILAGSWIEGLYVGCCFAKELGTESLVKAVLNQEESLKNLIIMLEASNLDETSQFLVVDLKSLQFAYKAKEKNSKYDLKAITEIIEKITALRNKLIAGS